MTDEQTGGASTAVQQRLYLVVLRARSAARFRPEEGHEFNITSVRDFAGTVRFRLRTRWVDEGHEAPAPRELLIEARGLAPSLDRAVSSATAWARFLATLVAFTANTQVDVPEPHIAFDDSDGSTEREFLEVFVPDERGHPTEGRIFDVAELSAVFVGLDRAADKGRISQAIHQYGLALRYWYFGGEWLALAHLYMAVETLTKVVIRRRCADEAIDEEALAARLAIDTADAGKWSHELEVWARRDVIFDGDNDTYREARRASDGVEHGFLEMDEVYRHALAVTEATFGYVRRAILRLLDIEVSDRPKLYDRPPRDVKSLRKMIRGQLIGDGTDPAPADEPYPRLEWNSSVKTLTRDGDKFSLSFQENFTLRCAPSYSFSGQALEVRGRAEPGSPIQLDAVVEVSKTKPSPSPIEAFDLMRRAHSFAREVAAKGASTGIPPLLVNVFGLLGVHLSLYEAIQAMLRDKRQAEAILLLRNLMVGVCQLQTIAMHATPAGATIRFKLDALERQATIFAEDPTIAERLRNRAAEYRSAAEAKGIEIPDTLPNIQDTEFYRNSANSLRFVEEVARGDDLAIAMHTVTNDEGKHDMHTQVSDDNLVRGIAGDAAIALLTSAVAVASVLDWPVDHARVREIETEAERVGADT